MTAGTIRNNKTGLEIHGDFSSAQPGWFGFRIDGTMNENGFMAKDWTFTPDGPELPTRIGSLVKINGHKYPFVRSVASWAYTSGSGTALENDEFREMFAKYSGT